MPPQNHLDELTAREREVLDLVRPGLTNDEIAGRLGITEAGAKYHVSQILSKLGVATREEAAAVHAQANHVAEAFQPRHRRWWAALPLAAKAAGVAVVLAAVAGLGLLAWGVLRTSGKSEDGSFGPAGCELTVESVVKCYGQATQRPNLIYHVTAIGTMTADQLSADANLEGWIDSENHRARYSYDVNDLEVHQRSVVLGEVEYLVKADGDGARSSSERRLSTCLDDRVSIPTVTPCPELSAVTSTSVRGDVLDGRPVVVLIQETILSMKTRLTLDASSYLPILFEREQTLKDVPPIRWKTRYQNEFVDAGSVPDNFFDPASIGYVEPSPTP